MNNISKLIDTIKILRSPGGCPWDKKQTLYTLKGAMLEEAAELADALDNKDIENIKEELGDLLLHIVMHSTIAEEEKLFNIDDVAKSINEKLIRRHPHVFNNENIETVEEVTKRWKEIKANEKTQNKESILDTVPKNLTSLTRAYELQRKAAKVNFQWQYLKDIFNKLDEEILELKDSINKESNSEIEEELGDVLFVISNIALNLKINPDDALKKANKKFIKRFQFIEKSLKDNEKDISKTDLSTLEDLWTKAKNKEKI